MKLIIVLAVVTWAKAGKLDRGYLSPNVRASAGSANFLQMPHNTFNRNQIQNAYSNAPVSDTNRYSQNAYSGYNGRLERTQNALERNAAILRQDNSNNGETYSYSFETGNGIYAEESGVATNGVQARGGYTYTGDDGKMYSVRYTADENGFIPQGNHLPTPHPIPEAILKALDQNARDEAAGIFDDGSYNEVKYSGNNNKQHFYKTNAQSINYNRKSAVVEPFPGINRQRNGY